MFRCQFQNIEYQQQLAIKSKLSLMPMIILFEIGVTEVIT